MGRNGWHKSKSRKAAGRRHLGNSLREEVVRQPMFEPLEGRLLLDGLPMVTGTTPAMTGGTLAAGATSLQVNFNQAVVGGGLADNYELIGMLDGLLGGGVQPIIPLEVYYSGTTATLTFPALTDSIYRLTVRDTITDGWGQKLDGDANGTAGGDWSTDFVALQQGAPLFPDATYDTGGNEATSVAVGDFNGDAQLDLAVVNSISNTVGILLGSGSGTFLPALTYGSGGSGAYSVAVGDFNGDAALDLAVTNITSNTVGILMGGGDGTFLPAATYGSGGSEPVSVCVGHFDGDTTLDLAVTNYTSDTIGILLGGWNGTFRPAVTYGSGGSYPFTVSVGDFDGDTTLDLAVANRGSDTVGVLLGTGRGTFRPAEAYDSGGAGPTSVSVGDFNGDATLDLAVTNESSDTVGILLGDGSGTFPTTVTFDSGGSGPYAVTVADFNGDTTLDLAVTNDNSNTVGILLGSGSGTFLPAETYSSGGTRPNSVSAGDFNGDAKLDLAVTNDGVSPDYTGTVEILLGSGSKMFSPAVTYGSGDSGLLSVTVGDFNGDARLDLAVANYGSTTVGVLMGTGNGTFLAAATYDCGGYCPSEISVGDFNGDMNLDLAVANEGNGTVGILLGNGDGSFGPAATYDTGGYWASSVAVGDFNGDTLLDLAVGNLGSDTVGILLGGGDGTFSPVQTYDSGGSGPNSVAVGDFNGDMTLDLVVTNYWSDTVGILLGIGDGTFSPAATCYSGGYYPRSVSVGDFNGDAALDIVVGNKYTGTVGTVAVLLGTGSGTFLPAVEYGSGVSWGGWVTSVTVGDFNGDTVLDIAATDEYSGTVGVLLGTGSGTFLPAAAYSSGGSSPYSVSVGDFNGDMRLDMVVANNSSTVGVLLNSGIGTFSTAAAYDSGGSYSVPVSVGDFNGDARLDLAVANNASGTLGILLGSGNGTFATSVTYNCGGVGPWSVSVGDFDGDTNLDLAVADYASNTVGILLGSGDGTFLPAVMYDCGGSGPCSFSVGYFNGDTALDLAVANFNSDTVAILLGNGDGTFSPGLTYDTGGSHPISVSAGDFNGDTKLDLAVANGYSSSVGILLGIGDGTFSPAATCSSGGAIPWSVSAGDFNGDARLDLAVANVGSDAVGILLGIGDGTFSPVVTYGSGRSGPYSVSVGDFNGDRTLDLAVANYDSSTIAILSGIGDGTFSPAERYGSGGTGPYVVSVGDFNGDTKLDLVAVNTGSDPDYFGSVGILLNTSHGPVTFASPNGFVFDVQVGGPMAGQLLQGTDNAFDGLNRLQVGPDAYSPDWADPKLDDGGRTLVTPDQMLSGLFVHREITVPGEGFQDFARTMDVFTNLTGTPITTTVRVVGNLGSGAATTVFATSSGDNTVDVTDQWFGTDDADGSGTPALIHYIQGFGPGGLQPTSVTVTGDNIEWTYEITVPSWDTVRLAQFTIVAGTRDEAIWEAHDLVDPDRFAGQAGAFLTPEEAGGLANFAFPSAPENDSFDNRTDISGRVVTVTGTNLAATKETGEPDPVGNAGGRSVWWAWTAPSTGMVQIDTIGSNFDTILGVYTGGSASGLTLVAESDDIDWGGGNSASLVSFNAVAGTTYQIAVDGYDAQWGSITLNVNRNYLPTLTAIATLPGATEDTPFVITYATLAAAANEADADGDAISFRIESVTTGTLTKNGLPVAAGSTLLSSGESLVWHSASSANGRLNAFTVRAWDGLAASATTVMVKVDTAAVNDAPVANDQSLSTNERTALVGTVTGSDADGNLLTYSVVANPGHGSVTVQSNGSFTYTPLGNYAGPDSFTFKANDGALDSAPAMVSITVIATNDAPTLTAIAPLPGGVEDTDFTITYATLAAAAHATDADGDAISFRIESVTTGTLTKGGVAVVAGTTLLSTGESLVWHPAANANGKLNAFTVKAWDGSLASADPAVPVQVQMGAVGDAPTLTTIDPLPGGVEDTDFTITYATLAAAAHATDADGDAISFRIESVTTGTLTKGGAPVVAGTTLLSTGESLVWHPAANANGTLNAFSVKAWDGSLASTDSTAQVQVQVTAVNERPTSESLSATADLNSSVDLVLAASDIETAYAGLTFNVPARAGHGTLTETAHGTFRYEPDYGFVGQDSFQFTVSDDGDPAGSHGGGGGLTSDPATVTIQVGWEMSLDGKGIGTYYDANNKLVKVALTGGGTGKLLFAHEPTSIDRLDAGLIVVENTTSKSVLTITTTGTGSTTTIGGILVLGDRSFGTITGRTTSLNGKITVPGLLGAVTLDDALAGSSIDVDANPPGPGTTQLSLAFDCVTDTSVNTHNEPIKSITATEWANTLGSGVEQIAAPWIGTITTVGRKAKAGAVSPVDAVAGDFTADLALSGAPGRTPTLGTVKIAGSAGATYWNISGDAGPITVTGGSLIGVINATGSIGSITVTGGDIFCDLNATGAIGNISVTGVAVWSGDNTQGEGSVVGGCMLSNIDAGQVRGKSIGNITLTGGSFGIETLNVTPGDPVYMYAVNAAGDIGNIVIKPLRYLAGIDQQEVFDRYGEPMVDRNGDQIFRYVKVMNQQGGGIQAALDTAGTLGNITAVGGDISGTFHAARGMGNIVAQTIVQRQDGSYFGVPYTTDENGAMVSNLTAALTAEAGPKGVAIASVSVLGGAWTGGARVTGSIGKIVTKCYAIVSSLDDFPAPDSWSLNGGGVQGQVIADSIGPISIGGGAWEGSMIAMTGGIGRIDVVLGSMNASLTAYSSIGAINLKNVAIPATCSVDKWTEDGQTTYDPFSTEGYVVGGELNVTVHLGYQSDVNGNPIKNANGTTLNTRATLGALTGTGANVTVSGEVPWAANRAKVASTALTYVAGYDWDDEAHRFTKRLGTAGGPDYRQVDLINSAEPV
jgi:ankyrin repeat protein